MNKIAGEALNVRTGRGGLLILVGRLNRRGKRNERQFVAVHGGQPEELKLGDQNQPRRDRP